ncbi:MAG TPA: NrfD/PsrC family molybdoenzyme membrane anchor subunit [Bryobacteraceae bacterium]|jgi:formate-dependent nitrite reductase membrane component NrfD
MITTGIVTYYDRPVLKPPVWIWTIPAYFFVGGVAGAAMTMGLAVQLTGGRRLRRFDERCRWVGAIGGGVGTVLLISDLGRKARFLAMLRVFRPSSPMSVGSWVLALATPLSAGSALLTMTRGVLRSVGYISGMGAGILGMPLASYTAVLLTDSAVPVWLATRKSLPLLFGASSAASLASVFELMPLGRRERAIVHRFGFAGRLAELAAGAAVERDAGADPQVGLPFRQGVSSVLWKTAKVLTVASLVLTAIPSKSSARRTAGAICGILGGIALRFAVFQAGKASALDPRATFAQQQRPQEVDRPSTNTPPEVTTRELAYSPR